MQRNHGQRLNLLVTASSLAIISAAVDTTWCWSGAYTRENCCDLIHGPFGKSDCWGGDFTYTACCKSGTTDVATSSRIAPQQEYEFDPVRAEQALGAKLDEALANGRLSHEAMEYELIQAASSSEDRIMTEPTARAYLSLLYHRQGRREEALAEFRKSHQSHKFHISTNGAWVGPNAAGYHFHDVSLSKALVEFLQGRHVRRVADFGCGLGLYVRDLRDAGLRAGGFDGNPMTRELSEGRCGHEDLSQQLDFGTRWGWLLSFEVAEHIPPEREAIFVDNLDRHACEGVVLSWGNQAGEGHVNCRPTSYVESLFHKRGFETLKYSTTALRESATLPWFKQTVLVLKRAFNIDSLDGCGSTK